VTQAIVGAQMVDEAGHALIDFLGSPAA
jgi:hypothetical protein